MEEAVLWVLRKTILSCWWQSALFGSSIKCFGWILPFFGLPFSQPCGFYFYNNRYNLAKTLKPSLNVRFLRIHDNCSWDVRWSHFPLTWWLQFFVLHSLLRIFHHFWLVLLYSILKRHLFTTIHYNFSYFNERFVNGFRIRIKQSSYDWFNQTSAESKSEFWLKGSVVIV